MLNYDINLSLACHARNQMQKQQLAFVKKYFIGATLIISLVMAAVFFTQHARIEKLTNSIMLQQARALLSELILTRKWVTMHGGVYVKAKPGEKPNPFLSKQKGIKVNIKDEDGNLYTLINPAIAVREISQISEQQGAFELHVASLDPVSPVSRQPDNFEQKALLAFEQGEKEVFTIEESDKGPLYRYMAPVKFEQRCNKCHAFQKLAQGDIRGGISINIPMQKVRDQLRETRMYSLLSAVLVLATLLALLALLATNFMRKLKTAQAELELSATTDNLTGLYNRRAAYERLNEELSKNRRFGKPLSCLMLDIDHFKRINDQYGHLVGDKVLKFFTDNLRLLAREYDILCRYGGEEFLVLLPETALEDAIKAAERYRQQMEKTPFVLGKQKLHITVSIGVTEAHPVEHETRDSFIGRADKALYQAKQEGRNKVVIDP
ncbi:diguanylate cyclase (GGDEF) domain-containing protein [Malonomonas rubra DSM 5091]|uniref:diguanylate cyclase n=2 Tax=Malonomonas rubra TaxID=57040 RepID=A0A1M6MQ59_MALRU|nr:diguanylate cyclase (GGDEF) domain-containing protein [Malonomonas rubra DSM 5091]